MSVVSSNLFIFMSAFIPFAFSLVWISYVSFSCLGMLANVSDIMLNREDESENLCLVRC